MARYGEGMDIIPDLEGLRNCSTRELEAIRSVLHRQLARLGPVIDGCVAVSSLGSRRKDGTKTPQTRVQRYRGKKMHAVHVPRDLEQTVAQWNREYQHALDLLRQMAEVNEQIIRNYTADKRAARQAQARREQLELAGEQESRQA